MSYKDSMLSSEELILELESIFIQSGFLITSLSRSLNNNFTKFELSKNKVEYCIYANIRNIGSAYLPNKPFIMRRQVGKMNFNEIPENTTNTVSMLLAIGIIENKKVLACWNPFYFVGHSTNRSCYVLQSSLEEAVLNGFYDGVDCKTPVLVCSKNNFGQLLKVYLERNTID